MDMSDIDQAIARLDAAEQVEANVPAPETMPEQVDPPADQPAEPSAPGIETPASSPTDTPAAPESQPSTESPKTEPSKTPDGKAKSDFAKSQQRKDDSWRELNAQKDAFKKEQQTLKDARDLFQREQEQFKVERAKQSNKFTPEQYEQAGQQKLGAANTYDNHAEGLEALAEKLEGDGKYPEAEAKKQQARQYRNAAIVERHEAGKMRECAQNMRQNPDPTIQQIQQRNQQSMRDYTLKAAEQWPDVAKEGSEFQKVMAGHLKEAAAQGIGPENFPVIMYHAARLTAAESAAARVPGMERELGTLRAKVKELETKTAPGGGNPAVPALGGKRAKTDAEEFEELRGMALNV